MVRIPAIDKFVNNRELYVKLQFTIFPATMCTAKQ